MRFNNQTCLLPLSDLSLIFARGETSLLDAIYMGITKMREAKYPRKALLIISDGGDNHSRYTATEVKSAVKEGGGCLGALGR